MNEKETLQERWIKYHRIKTQMRAGVYVPDEDFLFVKSMDQRQNARRGLRLRYGSNKYRGGPIVHGGYNTSKR